jgi:hypothetical protein
MSFHHKAETKIKKKREEKREKTLKKELSHKTTLPSNENKVKEIKRGQKEA